MQISRRDFLKATGGLTITAALSAARDKKGSAQTKSTRPSPNTIR